MLIGKFTWEDWPGKTDVRLRQKFNIFVFKLLYLLRRKYFPLTQQYYIKIWICIYLEKSEAFREYAEEPSLDVYKLTTCVIG
jgi:hypothetical protein